VLTADYKSCSGYLPGECWGRDTSIKVVGNFSNSIPDLKFDINQVLVAYRADNRPGGSAAILTWMFQLLGEPIDGTSSIILRLHAGAEALWSHFMSAHLSFAYLNYRPKASLYLCFDSALR
jgi:hypothetical protein